jgi:lysozyme
MSKTKLSAAVLTLVAAGASAPVILDQFIREKESSGQYHLRAYLDGARVWTVCDGKTEGVTPRTVMTPKECDYWRMTEIGKRLTFARNVITVPMSNPAWAGFGSFCFNVGNAACKSSSAARLINQGKQAEGCAAMLKWRYITRDGEKVDCSQANPYCAGLWDRRQAEYQLCLM